MFLSLALLPLALAGANSSATQAAVDVQRHYERWERRLRAKIADLHVLPADALKVPACDVVIGFAIGPNRRPTDIGIRESSCGSFYGRHAHRLVRRLGRVGPVPSASGKNLHVILKLTYGEAPDPAVDRSLTDALGAERQAQSRRNVEIVTSTSNRAL